MRRGRSVKRALAEPPLEGPHDPRCPASSGGPRGRVEDDRGGTSNPRSSHPHFGPEPESGNLWRIPDGCRRATAPDRIPLAERHTSSWSASLKVSGKLGFIDGRAGRHPFDQGTHSRTVGFPEQGGAKGGAHGHVHGLNPACILMKMCRCSGIVSSVPPMRMAGDALLNRWLDGCEMVGDDGHDGRSRSTDA